jgi:hypothetical protein
VTVVARTSVIFMGSVVHHTRVLTQWPAVRPAWP